MADATHSQPVGYRLDFKPSDPCYYSVEDFAKAKATQNDGAAIWGLFAEPQPGCSQKIEVYKGWCWVQPRYVQGFNVAGFMPLYLGPQIQHAPIDESVLLAFPSLVESRLRSERPDLYANETGAPKEGA